MFTATPTYSAITPRENRITPVQISTTTVSDVQPCTGAGWVICRIDQEDRDQETRAARKATPSMLTSRSPRVPPVRTIRQKCESRLRME